MHYMHKIECVISTLTWSVSIDANRLSNISVSPCHSQNPYSPSASTHRSSLSDPSKMLHLTYSHSSAKGFNYIFIFNTQNIFILALHQSDPDSFLNSLSAGIVPHNLDDNSTLLLPGPRKSGDFTLTVNPVSQDRFRSSVRPFVDITGFDGLVVD